MRDNQLQLVPEFVTFMGMQFPLARRDENGCEWFSALEVARVLGMSPRNGGEAAEGVPSEQRGTVISRTPGGAQSVVGVTLEGIIHMAARRQGGLGKEVVSKLVGFTLAAKDAAESAGTVAAQSLNAEDVRRVIREELATKHGESERIKELRAEAAALNARARIMREERLGKQLRLPSMAPAAPAESTEDAILRMLHPDVWTKQRDVMRKVRRPDVKAAIAHLVELRRVQSVTEKVTRGGLPSVRVRRMS